MQRLPKFYPLIDTRVCGAVGLDPRDVARELAAAGVRIAQFRHKGPWTREAFALCEEVGRILRDAGASYVVNDRADLALAAGADGVHLGQTDLPPAAVRSFAGNRLTVGFSTHNEAQLRAAAAEPVDYIALGPIFATASKENPDPTVGLAELRRLRPFANRPLVAIGGIGRANAAEAWAAGADSCAVVSDYLAGDWRRSIREWVDLAGG